MEKRKLSAIARECATNDMLKMAEKLGNMRHIVTASIVEDKKILLLYFYEIETLRTGKTSAAFRTFLSEDDYITQDLTVSKVKWKTASFYRMREFSLLDSHWNSTTHSWDSTEMIWIRSDEEKRLIKEFFKKYINKKDRFIWSAINRYQEQIQAKRLFLKHKKETNMIDMAMNPIKEPPKEFFNWVWETGMSFSRYVIYKETQAGKATCECTYCKKTGIVDRKLIKLKNNEKGNCPFCQSPVTFKARGKMAAQTKDERWVIYIDPTKEGFVFRYFYAIRIIYNDIYMKSLKDKQRVYECIREYIRTIYTFPDGKPQYTSYEWATYKNTGNVRWCYDKGKIGYASSLLYPHNLPQAWEHTPMKYSALEVLSTNIPTEPIRYERGIRAYLENPKLEWLCKMKLNKIAQTLIEGDYGHVGKVNMNGKTIYEIVSLNKMNIKILQKIDGTTYHLRLLQVAQQIGFQFKPEQLKEYYETFECNTEFLKQVNQKVSFYKLIKYISKESENYPVDEEMGCGVYPYHYKNKRNPDIERKRNTVKDWLEYLKWCQELKYDLDNMFIYMPKNFKKVHDRTAKEYQTLQDKKAAAEKKRQERLAKKRMETIKKNMEMLFKKNNGANAFAIKGNGLVLIVPENVDEIKAEGEALHHCVGSYINKVARGETSIFFVRKAKEADKPYFTMEFNNNHVIQCRGLHNCGMLTEVEAFIKVFEKKMQEAAVDKEKEKKQKRKVS